MVTVPRVPLRAVTSTGHCTTPDVSHAPICFERCRAKAVGRSEISARRWLLEAVDQLGELLRRGCEAERLARAAVELRGDLVEALLAHPGEAHSLREVLAKQAVDVLV